MSFRSSSPSFRRAVITGASSGIGAAFARALPSRTALLLTGRDAAALEELAGELRGAGGREVRVVTADLTEASGRAELIAAASAFAPDLLINDAGLGTWGAFLEDPQARMEATVLVNALAPVALTRALLPEMIERAEIEHRRCGLLNVASTLAFVPVPYGAVYGASKAFLLSFTEALAAELAGRPVDVLAVCPGPVRTAFFRRAGMPGGAPFGAQDPNEVARRALAELGRRTVTFTDLPSATLLWPIADMRVGLSRIVALGLGVVRHFAGRRAPEPETGETPVAEPPAKAPRPPLGAAEPEVPGTQPKRRRGKPAQ
ncbi:SDR family NAD(P)-dependent oxidoreductase [Benzoatithermus flavus]|uniref:SDR family NAD(P)-dependent oxidoreductase n=1 Tax=Benzoatithermus flavus TaxID=3108223 RepID=A0ABU8XRK6_9PROT